MDRCPKCGNWLLTRERDGHGEYVTCFLCGWCKDDGEPVDELREGGPRGPRRQRAPRRYRNRKREGMAL